MGSPLINKKRGITDSSNVALLVTLDTSIDGGARVLKLSFLGAPTGSNAQRTASGETTDSEHIVFGFCTVLYGKICHLNRL